MTVECRGCSVQFEAQRSTRKWCSPKCQMRTRRETLEGRAAGRAANTGHYHRNAERMKDYQWGQSIRRLYGITPEIYRALEIAQQGECAMCGTLPTRARLGVDHNHSTGAVRGLLCRACNTMVGYLEGSVRRPAGELYLMKELQ